jgi:hypothetical protein
MLIGAKLPKASKVGSFFANFLPCKNTAYLFALTRHCSLRAAATTNATSTSTSGMPKGKTNEMQLNKENGAGKASRERAPGKVGFDLEDVCTAVVH